VPQSRPKSQKTLGIGASLTPFSLPGIDGKTHTEKDYNDAKILCDIFTCNHCPDSVAAAERTEEIHQEYKGRDVAESLTRSFGCSTKGSSRATA